MIPADTYKTNRKHDKIILLILAVAAFALFLFDLSFGSVKIPFSEVMDILTGGTPAKKAWETIVFDSRLPQSVMAIAAGIALGISGLILQTYFRNPLAGPSVLGITSGASLGVAFFILGAGTFFTGLSLFSQSISLAMAAFAGAMVVMLLIMAFGKISPSPVTILVAGLMISHFIGALVSIFEQWSNETQLQKFVFWGFGSFSGTTLHQSYGIALVIALLLFVSFILVKPLNANVLGEQYARSMGISLSVFRWQVILITGLMAAIITAFCGPVAFVGMAVPHIARLFIRSSDHLILLPACALTGMILCTLCSVITRLPLFESDLPLNAVTSLMGAPVVIWIIIKQRQWR